MIQILVGVDLKHNTFSCEIGNHEHFYHVRLAVKESIWKKIALPSQNDSKIKPFYY